MKKRTVAITSRHICRRQIGRLAPRWLNTSPRIHCSLVENCAVT